MQLTEHFSLEEFTRSDTAARLGIDNAPPDALRPVLLDTARRMEHVRVLLGGPLRIHSVYRCEALERVLCKRAFQAWCRAHGADPATAWPDYFARKAHPKGMAVDFTAAGFGPPLKIARALAGYAEELGFDQLIWEFESWVHIGWTAGEARGELLTIDGAGTRRGFPAAA